LLKVQGCVDIRLIFRHLQRPMDVGVAMKTIANVTESGFDLAAAGSGCRKRNDADRRREFIVDSMR
jgi:hypothetical protein